MLTCYYRPKPGGFCKRYFRAINALLDDGHEVHYLAVLRFPIEREKCYFHRFPWPQGQTETMLFWAIFHALAPLLLVFLGIRWRISHCFAFGTTYGCILQPLRLFMGLPLALFLRADTIENHRIKGYPQWLILFESLIEGIAINGTRLFGVSEVLTQTVSARHRYLKPSLVATLRNDILPVQCKNRTKLARPIRLASVGILERRKNHAFLLECLAELQSEDFILNIYGSGTDKDELLNYANMLNLGRMVKFKGWVTPTEIWSHVDLFLMPSLHEGAPNAVLEALAYKIPIIASDIPEHNEILPSLNLLQLNNHAIWCGRLRQIGRSPELELSRLQTSQSNFSESLVFDWNKRICDSILMGT